ncbi:MAG: FAD-dependent oxidoreductase [Clostridia bacterium]|nr:FAD-dependent oxidoreductase [Clostridia bacterium]
MKKSVWADTVKLEGFESLSRDIKTDVLVIGGGICGILCAYYLTQNGAKCVIVEKNRICSGITENTTAKITSQHGIIYSKISKEYGKETARMYLDINQKAIAEFEKLTKTIDCDFEKKDAFTYSTTDRKKVEDEVNFLKSIGFDASFEENTELPFDIKGAVKFKNQAQFHPLKFLSGICENLTIYENTAVLSLTPEYVLTDKGEIFAKQIIVATHFPFINKHGSYFLKLYQDRSYVCAYEYEKELQGMYVDEDKSGFSLRSYENLLLIGGSGHRTGKESLAWRGIRDFADKYYHGLPLKYEWAAQDCMSLDSIPYIGQYSKSTPYLYVATGFNKWGMSSSMVSAMILSDILSGRKNGYAHIFSPQRKILHPQLFANGIEAAINLLTPTAKRCSHLGCSLKWNKFEHTWDCPCHGSRFDKDGNVIDNPATKDIK